MVNFNGFTVRCLQKFDFDLSANDRIANILDIEDYINSTSDVISLKKESDVGLTDYKFSCFNGYVSDVMLFLDRHLGEPKFYFFDKDWNLLRINKRGKEAPSDFTLPKPPNMDKMFEIASILSRGIPYVRVDLYNCNGHIYFGEMTFYPCSGFDNNLLPEADARWANLINLDMVKKG